MFDRFLVLPLLDQLLSQIEAEAGIVLFCFGDLCRHLFNFFRIPIRRVVLDQSFNQALRLG